MRFSHRIPMFPLLFILLLSTAIAERLSAQPSDNKDNLRKNKQLTANAMDSLAIRETYLLETAINRVIEAGKNDEDAEELINSTIMVHFRSGAKMQTCSMQKNGECKLNEPVDYKSYFNSLWRRGRRCNNMKVKFLSVRVVERNTKQYRCCVEFIQDYKSCNYQDITPKDVIIHFETDGDGNIIPKIGNATISQDDSTCK